MMIGNSVKAWPTDCSNHDADEISRAQSWVNCVPQEIGGRERRKAEHHDGARIEMPEQVDRDRHQHEKRQCTVGQQQHARLCSGRIGATTMRKFGTSDELDRLVSV